MIENKKRRKKRRRREGEGRREKGIEKVETCGNDNNGVRINDDNWSWEEITIGTTRVEENKCEEERKKKKKKRKKERKKRRPNHNN